MPSQLSRRHALAGGVAIAALGACQAQSSTNAPPGGDAPAPDPSALHLPEATPQSQQLGAAISAFGVALLTQLKAGKLQATVVASPLSAAADMLMLGEGAKGAAADALTRGLRLPQQNLTMQAACQAFANLAAQFVSSSAATVALADGVWADRSAGARPEYLKALADLFAAKATVEDLNAPQALADINQFVSDTTRGKIPTILSQMPQPAMMVLVNALYFKGGWKDPFDAKETRDAPFTHGDGSQANAPLMHQAGAFTYRETDTLQAVVLPYADRRFEMRLVLEKPGAPAGSWADGFEGYDSHREGEVFLPKLDLSWGQDITGALAGVGFGPALGASADYSAALTAPLAGLAVVQKCVLKVDEQGAEAAAATAVMMAGAAAPPRNPPPPFVFRADRPFHLMLAEVATGAPLILAYVSAPGS